MAARPRSIPRSRRSRSGSATGGCAAEGRMAAKTETPPQRAAAYVCESTEEQGQGFSRLEEAEAVLRDFSRFWEAEPKPAERRKLIASLFDRVWQDEEDRRREAARAVPALLPDRREPGRRPRHRARCQ